MLTLLIAATAPITTLTAEELHLHRGAPGNSFSAGWPALPAEWRDEALAARFRRLHALRGHVNQAVEKLVAAKSVPAALASRAQAYRARRMMPHGQAADIELSFAAENNVASELLALSEHLPDLLRVAACTVRCGQPPAPGDATGTLDGSAWDTSACGAARSPPAAAYAFRVSKAAQHKCPRCWRFASSKEEAPCDRCAKLLRATQG